MVVQANLQDAINLIEDSARELGYSLPFLKKNDKGAVWIYENHLLTLSRIGDMVIFDLDSVSQNLDINHSKAKKIYDELAACLARRYGECHDAVPSNVLALRTLRKLPQYNSEEEFSIWQAEQDRLAELTPEQLADEFLHWLAEQPIDLAAKGINSLKRGPIIRIQMRYDVFERLKSAHPEWTQAKVAMEALGELGESVTSDTVRNTYRLMGKKWERGDRIR